MLQLICMRGYPGSGKSTRAREIATELGAVIVSRDAIRETLLGRHWTGDAEGEARVSRVEGWRVVELLRAKRSVVVDNVHLNPDHLRDWQIVAALMGVGFEVVDVETPLDVCIARDSEREHGVGQAEIRRIAAEYA